MSKPPWVAKLGPEAPQAGLGNEEQPQMTDPDVIFRFSDPVTLIGGGELCLDALAMSRTLAPQLVAADGGANHFSECMDELSAVIGDLDSLERPELWRRELKEKLVEIVEQDTTDFEKCLYSVEAPYFLAVGFLGGRHDHSLAATHILLKRSHQRVVLLNRQEVLFLMPRHWRISLPLGSRVSLFPLKESIAEISRGLRWPIDGLTMEAGAQIGTSNEVASPVVEIELRGQKRWSDLIVSLDRLHLRAALQSLQLTIADQESEP